MKRSHAVRRAAAFMAAVPLLWLLPPSAYTQDLIFDEEDEVFDSDEYLIDEDDVEVFDSDTSGPLRTTGLVIPGEHLDAGTAELISDLIVDELNNLPNVQAVDYLMLRDEFDVMGAELALECAFDPVCLGRVGEDVGLDEIIIGRATGHRGGELQLVLDRIDTVNRSVIIYRPVRTDDDIASLEEMVTAQMAYLYGLVERPDDPDRPPPTKSRTQIALAWTALGLGATALIVGLVFGIKANGAEDDVTGVAILDDGQLDITQVEADRILADGENDALLANVMFGTGLALIGVSVLLFLITPGSDIADEADQQYVESPGLRPRVGASVTADGWGVFGQIRF